MNIGSFVGDWPINFATGPLTQPGKKLDDLQSIEIGTGCNGAKCPFVCEEDYDVKVGFALKSSNGVIFSSDWGPLLTLSGEQLTWHGLYGAEEGKEPQELNINIALAQIFRGGEDDLGVYPYLFGCTVYGDPDQVGVWGGSGSSGGGSPKKR